MSEQPGTKTWRHAPGATSAGALLGAMFFLAMSAMSGLIVFGILDVADWTPKHLSAGVSTVAYLVGFLVMLAATLFMLSICFRQRVPRQRFLVETSPDAITLTSMLHGTRMIGYADIASATPVTRKMNDVSNTYLDIREAGQAKPTQISSDASRKPEYFDEIVSAVRRGMARAHA